MISEKMKTKNAEIIGLIANLSKELVKLRDENVKKDSEIIRVNQ